MHASRPTARTQWHTHSLAHWSPNCWHRWGGGTAKEFPSHQPCLFAGHTKKAQRSFCPCMATKEQSRIQTHTHTRACNHTHQTCRDVNKWIRTHASFSTSHCLRKSFRMFWNSGFMPLYLCARRREVRASRRLPSACKAQALGTVYVGGVEVGVVWADEGGCQDRQHARV